MRKIKFKGKCVDGGNWVYGDLFIPEFGVCIYEKLTGQNLVNPESVCQYIGRDDSGGVEIYENDICEVEMHDGIKEILVIRFNEKKAMFEFYVYSKNESGWIISDTKIIVLANVIDYSSLDDFLKEHNDRKTGQ